MNTALWIHAASCWFMTGVIWLVQILVYPFFRLVGEKEFSKIHQFHTSQITWIVAPVMLLELASASWLYFHIPNKLFLWNLISVAVLWILTASVNVPSHNRLSFDSESSKKQLVFLNWPRTFIWTFRGLFILALLHSERLRSFYEIDILR
jgi:hypothetical protein